MYRINPATLRTGLAQAAGIEGSLLALGAITGLLTGILSSLLIFGIDWVATISWGSSVSMWELLVVPTLGAFVVGLIIQYASSEVGGSGVVRTLEILVTRSGRFRRRVPLAGVAATSVALGTGSSGGREGPMVLIGASMGSLIGQLFRLDEERLRAMVSAGVAAGIGAAFNAPIGGMLFAIEVILGQLRAKSLQVVVIGSVVGSVTAREIVGSGHILAVNKQYGLGHSSELLAYLLLGVAAAGLGIAISRGEHLSFSLFARLRRRVSFPVSLAIGGLGVGVIALVMPEVLSTGTHLPPVDGLRHPVQTLITRDFGFGWSTTLWLFALLVCKYVATMLSVGSGSAVGTLMPSLFMGATLGALLGTGLDTLIPAAELDPQAFALVGMAACFAAAARAPLTAVLLIFELTGDYGMVLPLMLCCGIAMWLAERVEPRSIYSIALKERGLTYGEPEGMDVLQSVTAAEIMTVDHPTLRETDTYAQVKELFEKTGSHGFAVVDQDDKLTGVLTRHDFDDAPNHPLLTRTRAIPSVDLAPVLEVRDLTARHLATVSPAWITPDDSVHAAVYRMASQHIGRIPVVERTSKKLVGLVRRADIVKAYQIGLNRRLDIQQRDRESELKDLDGVRICECTVHPKSAVASLEIRAITWPPRAIVISIRRAGQVILPHGDTVIQADDMMTILSDLGSQAQLKKLIEDEAVGQ